jgi:DNA-binding NtrC family response regulator
MRTASTIAVLTRSEAMRTVLARVDRIARSDTTVLLVGETGVGKELVADYIHRTSDRADRPLVKVALSATPLELLESELFGHEKGAFTSAAAEKRGLFELASGGVLFLDDIDDVPLAVQAKLLRVLESREVMRVGGTSTLPVDVRLISASKVDLLQLVERGLFRADLFYRLNVCPVEIPPLRARRDDVPLIFEYFLGRFAPGRSLPVAPDALDALSRYDWPGNVRELRNIAQRVALFAGGEVTLADLPREIAAPNGVTRLAQACVQCLASGQIGYSDVVACVETHLLRQALTEANGNQTHAAKYLGLSLSTFRDKLHKLGIEVAAS